MVADLTDRIARCYCGTEAPSSEWQRLAFFEYKGPGSADAINSCKHCRYHDVAHGSGAAEDAAKGIRPRRNVVAEGHCPGFEADPEGRADTFYCGCRGWD